VVPQVNHISAENLVTAGGKKEQSTKHTTYTVKAPLVRDLSSSSGSSESSDEGVNQYTREPGVHQTPSRSCSEDLDIDIEEYNEEPGTRKQRKGTKSGVQDSRKDDLKFSDKKTDKKAGLKLETGGENKSRSFADHVQNSPGISEDVWKEAMAGVPLASSESFDLLASQKDRTKDGEGEDDDAFQRRGRKKGKPARKKDPVSDLKWSADLPIDESLSRETLDDISCDSYVPVQQVTGWDVDSLDIDLDNYVEEEGSAKVLDILAQTELGQGRVVGRRKERVEQRKQTLSTSFETNVDEIEFDKGNVPNINKNEEPGTDTSNQNVPNIDETNQPHTIKGKEKKKRGNVSNINKAKEPTENSGPKPEEEKADKQLRKKTRQSSSRKVATIPILAADAAASSLPFEEDEEESYSGEPHDLSANINIRLWQGQDTNIDDSIEDDDDDLLNEDQEPSNLHDQRWEEESTASLDEKQPSVKPPTSKQRQQDSRPTGSKAEIIDRLPDRPRRSQPIAPPGDSQTSRQRKPLARNLTHRPYNGISTANSSLLLNWQ